MIRQSALSIVLGAALTAFAAGGGGAVLAQSDDEPVVEEEVPADPATDEVVVIEATGVVEELVLGDVYRTTPWDVAVQSVFDAPSPTREGWTEVRVAVSLRNNLPDRLAYTDGAFFSDPAYPGLAIVDASNTVRRLSLVRLDHDAVGGSAIQYIGPEMTGRWTIGFQVPTIWADELTVAATDAAGLALATWDLRLGSDEHSWDPPSVPEVVTLGTTIDWLTIGTGSIEAVPVNYGSLVCGDPDVEHVTQVFALQIDVTNPQGSDDIRWPGITFPATAATAMWADGTTADVATQTFAGEEELLRPVSNDIFIVPPGEPGYGRAFLFGPARDSRLGSVDDAPMGVLLNRPDAAPLWLDLSGASGTLELNPALCDDGAFGARLPFAFGPSNKFNVAAVGLPPNPLEQDREAQELLTQAAVSANQYFEAEGTYENVSSAALEDIWAGVDFTNTSENLQPGPVAWSVPTPATLTLTTASGSGRFFCVGMEGGVPLVFANSPELTDVETACSGVGAAVDGSGDTGEGEGAGTGEGEGTGEGAGTGEGTGEGTGA